MELKYFSKDLATNSYDVIERRKYIKTIASRYFRLQHGKSKLLQKQRECAGDEIAQEKVSLEIWKNSKKLQTQEVLLQKNIKTKWDFYAALEGVYEDYRKIEEAVKKHELTNHIMYSIIMFQIFLNGIISYFNEVSAKMMLYIGYAGIFSVIAGMSSFVKSFYGSKEYRALQNSFDRTLERFGKLFKDKGFI